MDKLIANRQDLLELFDAGGELTGSFTWGRIKGLNQDPDPEIAKGVFEALKLMWKAQFSKDKHNVLLMDVKKGQQPQCGAVAAHVKEAEAKRQQELLNKRFEIAKEDQQLFLLATIKKLDKLLPSGWEDDLIALSGQGDYHRIRVGFVRDSHPALIYTIQPFAGLKALTSAPIIKATVTLGEDAPQELKDDLYLVTLKDIDSGAVPASVHIEIDKRVDKVVDGKGIVKLLSNAAANLGKQVYDTRIGERTRLLETEGLIQVDIRGYDTADAYFVDDAGHIIGTNLRTKKWFDPNTYKELDRLPFKQEGSFKLVKVYFQTSDHNHYTYRSSTDHLYYVLGEKTPDKLFGGEIKKHLLEAGQGKEVRVNDGYNGSYSEYRK